MFSFCGLKKNTEESDKILYLRDNDEIFLIETFWFLLTYIDSTTRQLYLFRANMDYFDDISSKNKRTYFIIKTNENSSS